MTLQQLKDSIGSVDMAIAALIVVAITAGVTMSDPKDVLLSVGAGLVGYLSKGGSSGG